METKKLSLAELADLIKAAYESMDKPAGGRRRRGGVKEDEPTEPRKELAKAGDDTDRRTYSFVNDLRGRSAEVRLIFAVIIGLIFYAFGPGAYEHAEAIAGAIIGAMGVVKNINCAAPQSTTERAACLAQEQVRFRADLAAANALATAGDVASTALVNPTGAIDVVRSNVQYWAGIAGQLAAAGGAAAAVARVGSPVITPVARIAVTIPPATAYYLLQLAEIISAVGVGAILRTAGRSASGVGEAIYQVSKRITGYAEDPEKLKIDAKKAGVSVGVVTTPSLGAPAVADEPVGSAAARRRGSIKGYLVAPGGAPGSGPKPPPPGSGAAGSGAAPGSGAAGSGAAPGSGGRRRKTKKSARRARRQTRRRNYFAY